VTGRLDPAVARLLAGAIALAVLAAWTVRTREIPERTGTSEPKVGTQLAARGCIDPDVASAQDWRQVPGVTRQTAEALAETCRATRTCAPCGPEDPVRGVGPATLAKLAAVLCAKPGVSGPCPARTHREARAPPAP
jgi:hypothetical protein